MTSGNQARGKGSKSAREVKKLTTRRAAIIIAFFENRDPPPTKKWIAEVIARTTPEYERLKAARGFDERTLSAYVQRFGSIMGAASETMSFLLGKEWATMSKDRPQAIPESRTFYYRRGPFYRLTPEGEKFASALESIPESEREAFLMKNYGLHYMLPRDEWMPILHALVRGTELPGSRARSWTPCGESRERKARKSA